jgi:hypothetical protein
VLDPGWNQIGNPFPFPVAWGSVTRSPNVGDPHAFGTTASGGSDYLPDPAELLTPFEGYFVKNFAALPETIRILPDEAPAPPDRFASIAIAHRDWELRPGPYRRDLRNPNVDGNTFRLEIRGNSPARELTLRAHLEGLPAGYELRLFDLEQDVSHDFRRVDEMTLLVSTHRTRFLVLAGTTDYIERESVGLLSRPSALQVDASVPNPLRGAARIRFGLPEASVASLSVYDLSGRLVATVLESNVLEQGFHTAVWDGRDDRGGAVSSGIYFYRLRTAQGTLSRKLLVLR